MQDTELMKKCLKDNSSDSNKRFRCLVKHVEDVISSMAGFDELSPSRTKMILGRLNQALQIVKGEQ